MNKWLAKSVRWIFTVILIIGVYFETGFWTATFVFYISVCVETMGLLNNTVIELLKDLKDEFREF